YSLPSVIQSRSISHRLWLYGANLLLLCVVTLFSVAVRVTVSTERMIIVPIEKQESLVILTYVVSLLQALDVFLCFSGVWRLILDFVFTILWVIRFQHVHQTLPHFLFNQLRNKFFRSKTACAVWDNIQLEFNCCGVYSYKYGMLKIFSSVEENDGHC
uniref:Uncharacterized protein n=1 Tax=Romanomermis culicivorax TaxID=13658 RepID=A0A915JT46_ROMCU